MAASEVEICNLALLRVGVSKPIRSLTDGTKESNLCNVLYPQMRDVMLASFWWSFATLRSALQAPVDENEVARTGWTYIYALPTNCLAVQRIWAGARRVRADQLPPFKVEGSLDGKGKVLLTDREEPEVFFTNRITHVPVFSPLFADTLSSLIGYELVTPLALAASRADSALRRFQIGWSQAVANDMREHQDDPPPPDTFTAARGALGRLTLPYDVPVVTR